MDIAYFILKEKKYINISNKTKKYKDNFLDELNKMNRSIIGLYNPIKIGNYKLSIQASHHHYCTPREILRNLYMYTTMEIAIIKNNNFLDLKDDLLISFKDNDRLSSYVADNYAIYEYVPIKYIQSLYEHMIEYSKNNY